jgi:hypothetical protein
MYLPILTPYLDEKRKVKKWRERVQEDINETSSALETGIKEFYENLAKIKSGESNEKVEREIFESTRGIRSCLVTKKHLITLLEIDKKPEAKQYPIEQARFNELISKLNEASRLMHDRHTANSLEERRMDLLRTIDSCYSN